MEETLRALDRRRGLHAWSEVYKARSDKEREALADAVVEMESRIRTSGVAAALQYADEKRLSARERREQWDDQRADHHAVVVALEDWMRERFPESEKGRAIAERLGAGDNDFWSAVTTEALAYVAWLKVIVKAAKRED